MGPAGPIAAQGPQVTAIACNTAVELRVERPRQGAGPAATGRKAAVKSISIHSLDRLADLTV